MNNQQSFEAKAKDHNLSAEKELESMQSHITDCEGLEDKMEEIRNSFSESILSIDKSEVYDVCTGTGGPASGYRIYITVAQDGEKEFSHATSYFQDWGQPKKEMRLSDNAAEQLLSMVYIEGVS